MDPTATSGSPLSFDATRSHPRDLETTSCFHGHVVLATILKGNIYSDIKEVHANVEGLEMKLVLLQREGATSILPLNMIERTNRKTNYPSRKSVRCNKTWSMYNRRFDVAKSNMSHFKHFHERIGVRCADNARCIARSSTLRKTLSHKDLVPLQTFVSLA